MASHALTSSGPRECYEQQRLQLQRARGPLGQDPAAGGLGPDDAGHRDQTAEGWDLLFLLLRGRPSDLGSARHHGGKGEESLMIIRDRHGGGHEARPLTAQDLEQIAHLDAAVPGDAERGVYRLLSFLGKMSTSRTQGTFHLDTANP